jgi:hypothetical protein
MIRDLAVAVAHPFAGRRLIWALCRCPMLSIIPHLRLPQWQGQNRAAHCRYRVVLCSAVCGHDGGFYFPCICCTRQCPGSASGGEPPASAVLCDTGRRCGFARPGGGGHPKYSVRVLANKSGQYGCVSAKHRRRPCAGSVGRLEQQCNVEDKECLA